jgi:hypothetical protein
VLRRSPGDTMKIAELVDDLYEAFTRGIGPALSPTSRDLARALRLAPSARPWSRVFPHEIVLGAPALFGPSLAGVPSSLTRDAVLAHMLAVIDSFGIARVEDERIEASPQVFAVLGHVRRERDRAMARLFSRTPFADTDFRAPDAATIRALRRERTALKSACPADFEVYERTLVGKRACWFLASVALARIGGLGPRGCRGVRATLESACKALQIADDVVEWEADLDRGGTWATCLMRGTLAPPHSGRHSKRGITARMAVLESGVLERMLLRARTHMRAARRRASALGAERLACWAADQESRLESLLSAEAECAGSAARVQLPAKPAAGAS